MTNTVTNTTNTEYDFYAAGPFFNSTEVASMERLETALESHGKRLFKPRFESDLAAIGAKACFEADVEGIRSAKAVIANLIDDDPGTMFEIGYAHGIGKPVYAYLDGLKDGDAVNIMISQSVDAVFTSVEDLTRFLETGEHTDPVLKDF